MKFNEDILKAFDLDASDEKMPVDVMQVQEMLSFLKLCAERIRQKSKIYADTMDADLQMDCIDIVTAKLNDFAQVFRDLVIFMRKAEKTYRGGNSLRYCMASYDTFGFEQTENEKSFLKELLIRNEITHDYFNRELHQQKLIWIMMNCSEGAIDVFENLNRYCGEHQLLNQFANKNL